MTDEQVDPLVPAALRGFGSCFRTARVAPEEALFRPALPLRHSPVSIGTTMTKMTYGEQLKHPQWQRKRLQILERDRWECRSCADTESTLHVHHKHYVKGRLAWEYEDFELITLCESCHEAQEDEELDRKMLLAKLPADGPVCMQTALALVAGFAGIDKDEWMAKEVHFYVLGRIAWALAGLKTEALFNLGDRLYAVESDAREAMVATWLISPSLVDKSGL